MIASESFLAPLAAGTKLSFTLILTLRLPLALSVIVSVPRAFAVFDPLDRPLPETLSLPAAGTETFSVSVRLLFLRERILSEFGQP